MLLEQLPLQFEQEIIPHKLSIVKYYELKFSMIRKVIISALLADTALSLPERYPIAPQRAVKRSNRRLIFEISASYRSHRLTFS